MAADATVDSLTLDADAVLTTQSGGSLSIGNYLSVGTGATLTVNGEMTADDDSAGSVNDGLIVAAGPYLDFRFDLSGTGSFTIDAGTTLELDGRDTNAITFAGPDATLIIGPRGTTAVDLFPQDFGTLIGFNLGGIVEVDEVVTAVTYSATNHELILDDNTTQVGTLVVSPTDNFTHTTFNITVTGKETTIEANPCYCRGTLIRAERGEVPVEELAIGDIVVTASGAVRPIKWIGRRSYGGRFIMGRKDVLPICIKAGALDDNVPQRDLWISPHHAMYFKDKHLDGVLIEAKDLVNGSSIVQAERINYVEYFHVELESHDVIIAEGALSETFFDDDSRAMFHNADEYRVIYPRMQRQERTILRAAARRRLRGRGGAAAHRARAGLGGLRKLTPIGTLRGFVDRVTPHLIDGWAQNLDHPEAPVCLDIYAGGRLIGQVLANRYREDLQQAGMGSGSHSFRFTPPTGIMFAPGAIEVRRSLDGASLMRSADAQHKEELPTAA